MLWHEGVKAKQVCSNNPAFMKANWRRSRPGLSSWRTCLWPCWASPMFEVTCRILRKRDSDVTRSWLSPPLSLFQERLIQRKKFHQAMWEDLPKNSYNCTNSTSLLWMLRTAWPCTPRCTCWRQRMPTTVWCVIRRWTLSREFVLTLCVREGTLCGWALLEVENLQLNIRDVHVRYQDDMTNSQ